LPKILVLVSGNGSNLQALIDAGIEITAVLSDREGAYALERARAAGIRAFIEKPGRGLSREERRREHSERILLLCREMGIDIIIHAGFLSILAGDIIKEYSSKMINLHPALLPKYGGQGMYGEHVHRAVLEAGETESGCTVHFVDAGIDSGAILLQRKVPVMGDDTPESLSARIRIEEHKAIVDAAKMLIDKTHCLKINADPAS